MISLFASIIPGLFKIGDKMIADEDKKAEFAFKVQEMAFKQMETLINAKTYPWVDALVKLAYASEQIVKGLFTPIMGAIGFGFGLYFELNDISISGTVEAILFGTFPAWRIARQKEKNAKIEREKAAKSEEGEMGW
jgi:hypothetical protein